MLESASDRCSRRGSTSAAARGRAPAAERPPRLTVSELTDRIQGVLETEFLDVWVEGEVSNLKFMPTLGPLLLLLEGRQGADAGVVWRSDARLLKFKPKDGMKVLARGQVRVYAPRGEYQLSVQVLEPLGKGSLQQAFEELKERLGKEGLFGPERKRPLPLLPRRIGVVTSPTGAVIRDILRVLRVRYANLEVVIYPCRVQGPEASGEVAAGIRALNRLRRPRRADRGPGRGQPRGPLALQRRAGGPRPRRLAHPHHLGRGPRDRLHHRRLRGRPAGAHPVGRGRARGAGQGRPRLPRRRPGAPARRRHAPAPRPRARAGGGGDVASRLHRGAGTGAHLRPAGGRPAAANGDRRVDPPRARRATG